VQQRLAHRDLLVPLVLMALLDPQDQLVRKVTLVTQVDLLALQDLRVLRAKSDLLAHRANKE
jgi:hypothetical protein